MSVAPIINRQSENGAIELRIVTATVEELRSFAQQVAGPLNFDAVSDDDLLKALRGRMHPRGLVVSVAPFESEHLQEDDAAAEA